MDTQKRNQVSSGEEALAKIPQLKLAFCQTAYSFNEREAEEQS
ncbi:hypothetical protein HanHA300_Chr12g0454881 [Helianthus annuus]|nr:hypothetical protein HanHA300_Chr12g0454881 [Helianthus annuus]KAJ0506307.1 hypothetical protein HanHA89_Chr12g0480471 [Helianthus annuus]KAJ0675980.1 hypothetical protein HanLR1_Chr12g0457401 [Helianthus annuus]